MRTDEGDCCLTCICAMEEISDVMDAINVLSFRLQRSTQVLNLYTCQRSSHTTDSHYEQQETYSDRYDDVGYFQIRNVMAKTSN